MLTESDLTQFTGTEQWYVHSSNRLLYTDGIRYMASEAQAYWLVDAIASWQVSKIIQNNPRLREFQLWKLDVDLETKSCRLMCLEDSDVEPAIVQDIEYTDFPLAKIHFYCEPMEYKNRVLMCMLLPSEH